MVDADSPEVVGATLRTLRNTGEVGKKLLADAVGSREDLARWFVDLKDRQEFQRRLAVAYDEGELSLAEVDELRLRYDSLPIEQRAAYRELLSETGSDGVEATADLDPDAVSSFVTPEPEVAPDGGRSVGDYDRVVVQAAERNPDIDAKSVHADVRAIPDDGRRENLKALIARADEDGIRFVRSLDAEQTDRLLRIDQASDGSFDDWDAWRETLAKYDQRSSLSDAEVEEYLDESYEVAESDIVEGAGDTFEDVARLPIGQHQYRAGQFRESANEIHRIHAYGVDQSAGSGTVNRLVVDPRFESTEKDVDIRVHYSDGSVEYVEFKHATGHLDENTLRSNLFTSSSSVNEKYIAIGDEIPQTAGNRYGEITIRYSGAITTEEEFTSVLEESIDGARNAGMTDLQFDAVRVVPKNGESFVVDLDEYKESYP